MTKEQPASRKDPSPTHRRPQHKIEKPETINDHVQHALSRYASYCHQQADAQTVVSALEAHAFRVARLIALSEAHQLRQTLPPDLAELIDQALLELECGTTPDEEHVN